MAIKDTLRGLGLTKNEVEIYLTLLKSVEASVNEIASKSGLHRQVCYDALDRLVEKGFVSYILKDNKKYFKAMNPKKIVDYLDDKKDEVNSVLPKLTEMWKEKEEETKVEVIKGKNVMRTIYNDIFKVLKKEKQILQIVGVDEEKFLEFDEIAIKQHINRLKKNNLKEKIIARMGAKTLFEGKQSEYRFIPAELFNPNPTHIYGDNIAMIAWGKPVYGIIIKNKQLADANRKYFQMLWKIAKK